MVIEYEFKVKKDVLHVTTAGKDDNIQQVKDYGEAIIRAALEAGCRKVLCDERELEYDLDAFQIFESAEFIAQKAPRVAKVAIVCHPQFSADARFWETVALNRGLQIRMFHDLEKALEWMR